MGNGAIEGLNQGTKDFLPWGTGLPVAGGSVPMDGGNN